MPTFLRKWSGFAVACATFAIVSGCGSEPSAPLDPALTAKWVVPSVDTYCEFDLQQRGHDVSGTFGCFFAGGPKSQGSLLTGTAQLPHVILAWTDHGVPSTFDAILSPDQQTLTGTFAGDDRTAVFHRETVQ